MKIKESKLAHKYLDGLKGLEIGGGAHNPFGLDTFNVDITGDLTTLYKLEEIKQCGECMPVDIIFSGDYIPHPTGCHDFIVSSHVLEHFYNPIKTLIEWHRLVRVGGYVFITMPHKDRTFDKGRKSTTLEEFIAINNAEAELDMTVERVVLDGHHHAWVTKDLLDLCDYMNKSDLPFSMSVVKYQDVDDKAGNGFTIVLQKL